MKVTITLPNGETVNAEMCEKEIEKICGKPKVWIPENGEPYYGINMTLNKVDKLYRDNIHNSYSNHRLATGNFYKTEAEARAELDRQTTKAVARENIRRKIIELGLEFTPDWSNKDQIKYYVAWYSYRHKAVFITSCQMCRPGGIEFFFQTGKDCNLIMKSCESDFITLYTT